MDTLSVMLNLTADLVLAWLPWLVALGVTYLLGRFAAKTVRTARANAAIRSARRAREAYRAPVIDITDRVNARRSA